MLYLGKITAAARRSNCLLYTSDAADDLIGVDLGGRRISEKKIDEKNVSECELQKKESHNWKHDEVE